MNHKIKPGTLVNARLGSVGAINTIGVVKKKKLHVLHGPIYKIDSPEVGDDCWALKDNVKILVLGSDDN